MFAALEMRSIATITLKLIVFKTTIYIALFAMAAILWMFIAVSCSTDQPRRTVLVNNVFYDVILVGNLKNWVVLIIAFDFEIWVSARRFVHTIYPKGGTDIRTMSTVSRRTGLELMVERSCCRSWGREDECKEANKSGFEEGLEFESHGKKLREEWRSGKWSREMGNRKRENTCTSEKFLKRVCWVIFEIAFESVGFDKQRMEIKKKQVMADLTSISTTTHSAHVS